MFFVQNVAWQSGVEGLRMREYHLYLYLSGGRGFIQGEIKYLNVFMVSTEASLNVFKDSSKLQIWKQFLK